MLVECLRRGLEVPATAVETLTGMPSVALTLRPVGSSAQGIGHVRKAVTGPSSVFKAQLPATLSVTLSARCLPPTGSRTSTDSMALPVYRVLPSCCRRHGGMDSHGICSPCFLPLAPLSPIECVFKCPSHPPRRLTPSLQKPWWPDG